MQRYFVLENAWQSNQVEIKEDDMHHIKKVMRMEVGDRLECVHPSGAVAECEIQEYGENRIVLNIKAWLEENTELPVSVTIVQGLPKKDKLEFVLQKGTELGAFEFLLYEADRSIVQWDKKKQAQKVTRYNRIVKEASEQCHRQQIPDVSVKPLKEVVQNENNNYDVFLFAFEEEAKKASYTSFHQVLEGLPRGSRICLIIGPEGGFSEKEVQLLKQQQAQPIRLGPRILRTETAALYALASISYYFEEMEG
ncbi:MAG TPA: 16S rRNA (uracil(1498)-N(3))-methyltransferase [Pseudogracilibacillus sp.]|nr:16S rRNA (uracil(1498)-N(3))-methyltransferase [Pseudogracilibacillus sp.]